MTVTLPPPSALPAVVPSPATAGFTLTCKQPDLAHALSIVNRAVLPNSTKPILSAILLAVDGHRLRLSATNLEIGIQAWVELQHLEGKGATALPADLLNKVIGLMPHDALEVSMQPGSLTLSLRCAGNATVIRAKDAPEQFPQIPGVESAQGGSSSILDAGLLKTMIGQVAFAVDHSSQKAELAAALLKVEGGMATMAAANTFRLVERQATLATSSDLPALLIPGRTLQELERILPATGQVQILVTPQCNQVMFHTERLACVSRLIDGIYPPYQRAIPQSFSTHALVETRALAIAVQRAALFSDGGPLETVQVNVKPRGEGSLFGLIEIGAAADTGQTATSVVADVTGPGGQITFPVKYLDEALDHLDSPQVRFSFLDAGKPGVFKPVNETPYISMVMSAKPPATK